MFGENCPIVAGSFSFCVGKQSKYIFMWMTKSNLCNIKSLSLRVVSNIKTRGDMDDNS